ncbi:MAG: PIN domain-containing protein [Leptospiraceae bacterium]|nr:PIN domain-containing protein [Leptospiraceae bacterium]
MQNVALIDSGPIVALFDKRDNLHKPVMKFMQSYKGSLLTTWAVLTEVLYLLSFSIEAQQDVLEWISRGSISLKDISIQDIKYIKQRMLKYSNVPMDLADASLMCISEKERIKHIISVDSDLSIYRTLSGKYLTNLFKA